MRKREREEREEEREVEAQEGHQGEEVMTTQEECVEEKREEENSRKIMKATKCMHSAKGRRRIWRAVRRAAEQARDEDRVEETQRRTEEVERENWERRGRETQKRQCNEGTLHLVLHLPANTTTAASAARTCPVLSLHPSVRPTGIVYNKHLFLGTSAPRPREEVEVA